MSSIDHDMNTTNAPLKILLFRDFDVSWVGECPGNQGLCFGSEDGRIGITSINAQDELEDLKKHQSIPSGEAVNGAAFLTDPQSGRRVIAVSTRCDVSLIVPSFPDNTERTRHHFPWGARGVYATSTGNFVAPLGTEGLMMARPAFQETQEWRIARQPHDEDHFYALAPLFGDGERDVFACAARHRGLVAFEVSSEIITRLRRFWAPDVDIVDVCSLATPRWPYAAAALSADGSVHLSRNLLDGEEPLTLRSRNFGTTNRIQGTPYTIQSAKGHLFLLTSSRLLVFPNLISRFLEEHIQNNNEDLYFSYSIDAVDAYVAHDKLFLPLDGEVGMCTINSLVQRSPGRQDSTMIKNPLDTDEASDWSMTEEPAIPFREVAA